MHSRELTSADTDAAADRSAMPESADDTEGVAATPSPVAPWPVPAVRSATVVGDAHDPAEVEAERSAEQVVDILRRQQRGESDLAGPTAELPVSLDRLRPVRRAATMDAQGGPLDSAAEGQIDRMRGGGSPMPASVRAPMESAFGANLSQVRVHSGGQAAALNERLGSHAFTLGNDIVFGSQLPDAQGESGQRLWAHELTHVLQQRSEGDVGRSVRRTTDEPQPASSPKVIRRMKIMGPRGPIHVNDYHFIDRLTLTNAPKSGKHDVVIKSFTDFSNLASVASVNVGQNFKAGGVDWGWRGEFEIFPIADDKNCVTLTALQIQELISRAREGDVDGQFVNLEQGKVTEALKGVEQQSKPELKLPINTTANELKKLPHVRFAEGSWWSKALGEGGTPEAFLMGPNGAKREGPHLHIFLKCDPKVSEDVAEHDHPFVIQSYVMTTSAKKHLVLEEGVAVDSKTSKRPALLTKEIAEVEEMTTLCEMLNWASLDKDDSDVSSNNEEPVEEFWEIEDRAVDELDQNCISLGKAWGVRSEVLKYFFKTMANLGPSVVASLKKVGDLVEHGYGDDVPLLAELDKAAAEHDMSPDDVIALLDPDTYPSDTEELKLFYKKLITDLDQ